MSYICPINQPKARRPPNKNKELSKMSNQTTSTSIEKTIVCFHIGRGGHFHNPGHKSFIGEEKIGKYTDDLFLNFENESKVLKKVRNNSILIKFESEILDAITERNFEILESFGITEDELGDRVYTTCVGNSVGLTEEEEEIGVGCINKDGDYDTTYCCFLEDCNDHELQLIIDYNYDFQDSYIYAAEKLGIEEEENN